MSNFDSKENTKIRDEVINRIKEALGDICSGEARIMFVSKDGSEQKCCKTMFKDNADGHTLNMTIQLL